MTEELDQSYLSSDLPRLPKALENVNKVIVPPFIPISYHRELIQGFSQSVSSMFACLNQEDDCLLLMHPEATGHYFLLTRQPLPYSFVQEMEGKRDCYSQMIDHDDLKAKEHLYLCAACQKIVCQYPPCRKQMAHMR